MSTDRLISGELFGALSAVAAILAIAFGALWGWCQQLKGAAQPADYPVLEGLRGNFRKCRAAFTCLAVAIVVPIAFLVPTVKDIVSQISLDRSFDILRALLCFYFILLLCMEVGAWCIVRGLSKEVSSLTERIRELRRPSPGRSQSQ